MASTDPARVSEFAWFFRNADPRVYDAFIRFLDQYTYDVTVAVTDASNDDILTAKGRAQQARKFFQLFSEPREPKPQPSPPKP